MLIDLLWLYFWRVSAFFCPNFLLISHSFVKAPGLGKIWFEKKMQWPLSSQALDESCPPWPADSPLVRQQLFSSLNIRAASDKWFVVVVRRFFSPRSSSWGRLWRFSHLFSEHPPKKFRQRCQKMNFNNIAVACRAVRGFQGTWSYFSWWLWRWFLSILEVATIWNILLHLHVASTQRQSFLHEWGMGAI